MPLKWMPSRSSRPRNVSPRSERSTLRPPATEIDFAEVDDRFSYKELQHLEAVGLAKKGEAGRTVLKGGYDPGGALPVNVAGGSLGCGNVFEATGLHRAAEVALQLRGDAG